MLRGFVTAARTLTIIPVPGRDAHRMADALPWFPLVGCILGLALYLLSRAVILVSGGWAEGAAATVLVGDAILIRGFHLDGLADWADAFGGGRDKAHTLAIMKDVHVGAFGVLAVILVLLVKYVSLLRLVVVGYLHVIVPVYIISRTTMVALAVCLPYARAEGGTGDPFVRGGRVSHLAGALFLSVILLFILSGLPGLIILAGGFIVCGGLGFWFRRRVGGVTGDLLGACCELVETMLLFFSAAAGHWLSQFANGRVFSI